MKSKYLGKITPISTDVTLEYLMDNITILGAERDVVRVLNVTRLKSQGLTAIIEFDLAVPRAISVDNIKYEVTRYKRPPIRYYKCLRFAHGSIACTAPKQRCHRCCFCHDNVQDCKKPFYCIFCSGDHRYTSSFCPIYKKVWEINLEFLNDNINEVEYKHRLRALNDNMYKGRKEATAPWQPGQQSRQEGPSDVRNPRQRVLFPQQTPGRSSNGKSYATILNGSKMFYEDKLRQIHIPLQNRYDSLTADSDLDSEAHVSKKRDRPKRPHERRYYQTRYFSRSDLNEDLEEPRRPQAKFQNRLNDHNYISSVFNSPEYRSTATGKNFSNGAPPDSQHVHEDPPSGLIVFKFIHDILAVYFHCKSLEDAVPRYEAISKAFSKLQNSH